MYAIETKGLTRCFGPVRALSGLDLAVPEGTLYALLGVNGAGKSTAIKILTGLLPPTSGEARVLGYDVTGQREEVKKRISLCPQDTAVAPNLTVEENLMLLAGLSGARRQEARARRELWRVIEGLKGRTTVVLTTHYLEEAQALADSIGILSRGRLTAQGTAEELIRRTGQGSLEDAFVALTLDADTKGEWEGRP